MSLDTMRQRCEQELIAVWAVSFPTIPIAYENVKFQQPLKGAWAKFYVQHNMSKAASVGTTKRFKRDVGFIVVEVYVPEDTGTASLNAMIDSAVNVYEDRGFLLPDNEHVQCYTGNKKVTGLVNGYYAGFAMIPYKRDACKPPPAP